MSGHSKWTQIKHKKAGTDAKRGALFSKLTRLITASAREGGGDPNANFKLRQAVDQARAAGLPKDNIERAIARSSTSGAEDANLKEVEYEAYGPGGSAFLISGLTDNSNRTTNEIKHLLEDHGGRLAASGSVAWMFERRIVFEFAPEGRDTETTELALIDAGADDTRVEAGFILASLAPEKANDFEQAAAALGLKATTSSFVAIPKNTVVLNDKDLTAASALSEALENHQDINDVWVNIGN